MKAALLQVKSEANALVSSESNAQSRRYLYNWAELLVGTFWPTLVFCFIYRMNFGWFRYNMPTINFFVAIVLPPLILAAYTKHLWDGVRSPDPRRNPARWKLVLCIVNWFVIVAACFEGDKSFWRFSSQYYDFQQLATYINVDPSSERGQSYMDAGQVYFKDGTRVETSKGIAYQEDEIYCVAPLVQLNLDSAGTNSAPSVAGNALQLPKSGTIDFWAVGINCCDPSGLNFKCGEVTNPRARAGIRILRDDIRPFYYMAVQEWAAWLQMPVKHPLFFTWVQDPLLQVDNFWMEAMSMYYRDALRCLLAVFMATVVFHYILFNLGF